ncbi:MAG: methionine--tRNA ligase [Leptospiraceae bacterium]|nr:methionine--tRNA ligase [Leptospiraceae bacterium]
MSKRLYVTTPIYYANDKPHIGHAYTTLLADVICRFHRLLGYQTWFLTGTDEHGQKVQQAAQKRNISAQEHVDEYHLRFKEMWQTLGIEYNRFIRTTDADHIQHVQSALQELYDKGEIYAEKYAGWYSVGEERFFSADELIDGKDPISGRAVDWLEEKNYFFKMSRYQEQLIRHIEEHPDFILPAFRKNEVLGFLRQPLQDLCISRPKSRLEWGIPLPFDNEFVTYVWFDALLNYESGVQGIELWAGEPAWPADYHIIGKDILTTHAVYWPTMLLGMGRPLPRHILAHGWWLLKDSKMSKSEGNVVNPLDYIAEHGVDTVRYFLLREMVVGQDASFSDELFVRRINTDLANDLGNAINRVNKFVHSHFDGRLPEADHLGADEENLLQLAEQSTQKAIQEIRAIRISVALEEVMSLVRATNKYIDKRAPWQIARQIQSADPADQASRSELQRDLAMVLYTSAETLRLTLCLLSAVIPQAARKGLAMLGQKEVVDQSHLEWGYLAGGEALAPGEPLFPRIENPADRGQKPSAGEGDAAKSQKAGQEANDPASKLELVVVEILSVTEHPEAEALYVLRLQDHTAQRTVCAGLRQHYQPGELLHRKAVLFANLKPARLRGIESNGMLLAATDQKTGQVALIDPGSLASGTLLSFGDLPVEPKKKAGLKDFEKLGLHVQGGQIVYGDTVLQHKGIPVRSDASDGSIVK